MFVLCCDVVIVGIRFALLHDGDELAQLVESQVLLGSDRPGNSLESARRCDLCCLAVCFLQQGGAVETH